MGQPSTRTVLQLTHINRTDGPMIAAIVIRGERDRERGKHTHAFAQLFASSSGLITIATEQARWVVPPGRAMWVPPGVPHAARVHGHVDGWFLYVGPSHCARLPAEPCVVGISPLLERAIERAATWTPKTRALTPREERIARVLLDEIETAPSEPLHVPMPSSPSLARIARALVSDPASPRTIEEWAQSGGLAPRSLTRHFRAETGMSFGAWRTQLRMLVALERLVAGKDVAHIAFELGYESVSAFIAAFRRTVGMTPKRYARLGISAKARARSTS